MYVIIICVIILDGIITYFIPGYYNNINYFYPMLSVTFLTAMYYKNNNYLKKALFMGLIYDVCYSYIFLYNTLIFLILAKINKKIFDYLRPNIITKIIVLLINIVIYDTINFLVVYISKYNLITINDLFYKISHSLIVNIMSLFVFLFILKKYSLKHKI